MLPDALRQKPLRDWKYSDLELVIGSEESIGLELKSGLQVNKDAKGWQATGKLHRSETDGLAKEVVAFANAYGGDLIVGIEESDDHPKRATKLSEKLNDVDALVDQLKRSFASLIDPPLVGLELIALKEKSEDANGFLVIKITDSLSKPHGYGTPSLAYIRKDDRSEPMKMHQLHDRFYEAQTSRQRLAQELSVFSIENQRIPVWSDAVMMSATIAPIAALQIADTYGSLRDIKWQHEMPSRIGMQSQMVTPGNYRWIPDSLGAKSTDDGREEYHSRSEIRVTDRGTANALMHIKATSNGRSPEKLVVYPEWFTSVVGDLISFQQTLLRKLGVGTQQSIFTAQLKTMGTGIYPASDDFRWAQETIDFNESVQIGNIRIHDLHDDEAFSLIERKIWNVFHLDFPDSKRQIAFEDSQ